MLRRNELLATDSGVRQCYVPKSFVALQTTTRCRVHPMVIFTIFDAYLRRKSNQEDVIGTLLGTVTEGNVVDISDCFVDIYIAEEETLQIGKEHHENMYDLKHRINSKEQVVGWFKTGNKIDRISSAVNSFFKTASSVSKFVSQSGLTEPIHLLVDTSMEKGKIKIQAYMQFQRFFLKDLLLQFNEIPTEIETTDADKSALSVLLPRHLDGNDGYERANDKFESILRTLLGLFEVCHGYVRRVLDKESVGDPEIGRALIKALGTDPMSYLNQFENICQASVHDNLVLSYLSHLATLQLAIAERLNTSFKEQ